MFTSPVERKHKNATLPTKPTAGIVPAARDVEETPEFGLRAVIEDEEVRSDLAVLCDVQAPLSSDTTSTLWLT
jgi:hypothetical protein